uniref:Fibrinogen C-terminal domain-containing protein n=1 Tax=Ciona savignyi TaxID=51511 RepID=H2Z006_CIOSA
PKSCKEALRLGLNESGIQLIYNPENQKSLKVYCDQTTDSGGWIVFQRRTNGSENFYRTWVEYQRMFGNLNNEFWLGNENIHALTRSGHYELRIELGDCEHVRKFAKYRTDKVRKFIIALNFISAGDSLSQHSGFPFSTKDEDNDSSSVNCAIQNHGAWWYSKCHYSNLNGIYLMECQATTEQAASWKGFHGFEYSMKFIEMKFR